MADNLSQSGTGGLVRTRDRASVHTQVHGLDLNPLGATELLAGLATWANAPSTASVTTTSAQVLAAGVYRMVVFDNLGGVPIYLGASGVTVTSFVVRLAPGDRLVLFAPDTPANAVHAIVASGTGSLEVGLAT